MKYQRMTTGNPQNNYENLQNYCFAKEQQAVLRYADNEENIPLHEYCRRLCNKECERGYPQGMDVGDFGDNIFDCDEDCAVHILYVLGIQAADNNARLKRLEDNIENGELVEAEKSPPVPYEKIKDLYNSTCKSLRTVKKLSEARKKSVKARFNEGYSYEDFGKLFGLAEASDFLKGKKTSDGRSFKADFDWLIKDSNFPKVLEEKYSNEAFSEKEHSFNLDMFPDVFGNR